MNKSQKNHIKYPKASRELIELFEEDQKDLRENLHYISELDSEIERATQYSLLSKRRNSRAERMLEILDKIGSPSISNIGIEGSESVALLALHSRYEIMETILKMYETIFRNNPNDIYTGLIPSLVDRIMIRDKKVQKYGTHWLLDKSGKPFLVELEEYKKMNSLRAVYGLKPTKRPVNLAKGAIKYPLGKGLAKESDQKKLTNDEYNDFIKVYS